MKRLIGTLLAAGVLAGCGSHPTPVAAPKTPAASLAAVPSESFSPAGTSGPAATTAPASTEAAPATTAAAPEVSATQGIGATVATAKATSSPSPLPPLRPRGTATPAPPRPTGSTDAAVAKNPQALASDAYAAWMTDLSGLYDNLSQPWLDAINEIATSQLKQAAYGSATAIEQASEHGIGTLVDSHRTVSISADGTVATITDCLDEYHWYVVKDDTGKPDPDVSRGYFMGDAKVLLQNGQWYVSAWNSHPTVCKH